jgi:hypothetical protein
MLSRVIGHIEEVMKDGRRNDPRDGEKVHREHKCRLMSPLVERPPKKGEEAKMSKVHPFWAVIQCINAKSVNNMKLSLEDYVLPQSFFKGCRKPYRDTVITLPVLRNIVTIDKGDILTVPCIRQGSVAERWLAA